MTDDHFNKHAARKTIEECKRHVDECAALLERTSVPEYREAIIAMGKAWMKIAERALIKASC